MDLFDTMMIMTIMASMADSYIEERQRENENLLIPSWLFGQSSSEQIQPIFGRIERRPTRPSQTEDLPIIPDWMFQDNDLENDSQNTGRRIGLVEDAESLFWPRSFTGRFVQTNNRFRRENRASPERQRRCICGMCNLLEPVKITETKEKLVETGKNDECPITYEQISYGDAYLCCSECKYNFSEEAILKHLNGNSTKRECPMCRTEWKDYCKYINKDSLREKQELLRTLTNTDKFNVFDIKTQNTKDIYSYIGDVNKTIHNKKWFYGK